MVSAGNAQRAVFVIGAGRSGTSAIARGIQALGVDLGNDFKRASGKNPTGFFEDRQLLDLSKRVRRTLGLRADSVALIDPAAWQRPDILMLQQEAISTIRRRFGSVPVWGFKYGRTLRLIPFWEGVFAGVPIQPSFVFALRDPLSVARSRARLDARRGTQEQSDLEWLAGIVPYLRRLKDSLLVVVDYDLLMLDPEAQLRRIATRLQLPVDSRIEAAIQDYRRTFLDPAMQRNRFAPEDLDKEPRLNPLCRDAYHWLRQLAEDRIAWDSAAFWTDWQRIEAGLAALGPMLEHTDRIAAGLRRAAWNPLTLVPRLLRFLRGNQGS